ncbi:MAG: DNA polymerase III subunit delta' [Lysobacteraceae bacterium]
MSTLAPWLREPLRRALEALAGERLAHALLVCGPMYIGKHAIADALAQAMLCRERVDGAGCGHCRSCELFATRTAVDPSLTRPDGSLVHPDGRSGHPDFKVVSYEFNEKTKKMFGVITVEQMRELGGWFALTAQRGGAQVALIDPANAMNENASNALLKTLEEPMQDRYLLLLCESPMQLSATIRSRCQRINLQPPATSEGIAWLHARGHGGEIAQTALTAARGHPGLAAHWIEEGLLALRDAVRADLSALAAGRAQPLAVAAAWLADDQAEQRLAFAADLAVDLHARTLGADDSSTIPQTTQSLGTPDLPKLSAWFDAANRTRDLLRTPIRSDLALAGLLRDWRIVVSMRPA